MSKYNKDHMIVNFNLFIKQNRKEILDKEGTQPIDFKNINTKIGRAHV